MSPSCSIRCSNLQNFLCSMTPIVPSKPFPKSCMHDLKNIWHSEENEAIEYFTLGDLWSCFDEWSAYGVGTPVVLSRDRIVMQYYAPYLSAIQIYTAKSCSISRNLKEDSDHAVDQSETECWSNGSETDKLSRSLSDHSNKAWDGNSGDLSIDHHEGSMPNKAPQLGDLYFQYQDVSSPYWRIPIAEKITDLTQSYPGLLTLKSVDLSPASWMSIAWYPIYHIPTKWYVKDLSTSFLTYHTLSSSFQESTWEENNNNDKDGKCLNQVSLPPFGLATHRMQGDVWINQGKCDHERVIDLHGAADSWLKQLNFNHHDFCFFNMHSNFDI